MCEKCYQSEKDFKSGGGKLSTYNTSMTNIAVHNSENERESHDGEQTRVHLRSKNKVDEESKTRKQHRQNPNLIFAGSDLPLYILALRRYLQFPGRCP